MGRAQSYKDLEIYKLAMKLMADVHTMSLNNLPRFEMYEEGSQIRRSSKSIVSNIIEGFGRRYYKNDFIRFLTFATASCDETKGHLEMLYKTKSLSKDIFEPLLEQYKNLGRKIYSFRKSVIERHNNFQDTKD